MSDRVERVTHPATEAKRLGRAAGVLSIGVGPAAVLTYGYFALASRLLDKAEYGQVVILWSAVFITVSTIFRPIEQLLSRTIAEYRAHDQPIGPPLRVAAVIHLVLTLGFVVVALAFRRGLQDGLLSGDSLLYWILVGGVLAFGASFFARGFLAGNARFGIYATLLLADALARISFALAVAVGIAHGEGAIALGIVAAPLLSLLVLPLALGRGTAAADGGRGSVTGRATVSPARDPVDFTFAHGSGFAAAVLVIMFSEQVFLNAGPLLIRESQGVAAAGFIFNVLMVARAPLVLFQATATSLLPHLMRLRSRGGESGEKAFQLSVKVTILAIAIFTGLITSIILVAGPDLMTLAFGSSFSYDRSGLLIVSVGMGFYLMATTLNQAALAHGQARRAAVCYGSCALAFVAFNLLGAMDEFRRVEVGFAGAAALLCSLLYLLYRWSPAGVEDVPGPGSQELELRLAAVDEAT